MRRRPVSYSLSRAFLTLVTVLTGLAACSSSSSDSSDKNNGTVDCTSSGTVPKFTELAALSKCTGCHSANLTGIARSDAPASVNFDSFSAAKSAAEDAIEEVKTDSMPPAGSPQLTAVEVEALERWVACGTPE